VFVCSLVDLNSNYFGLTRSSDSNAAAYISKEILDTGNTVLRIMFWSYALNNLLKIVMLIIFLFYITHLNTFLNNFFEYLTF